MGVIRIQANNNKLISIIIPVYNVEPYLRECVDSALGQTYAELEVILVDDGSTDKSPQICDEYAVRDGRIRTIHKANSGLSDARNVGFEASHGRYVYFLDSDDYIAETAIDKLIEQADREQADIVFFDASDVFERDVDQSQCEENRYIRKHWYRADRGPLVLRRMLDAGEYRSAVPLLFIRTNYIREHGFRFYHSILHEDELYTFSLFIFATQVAHLNEPLYFRRVRANSIMTTSKSAANFVGYATVFSELLKLREGKGAEVRDLAWRKAAEFANTCITVYYALPRQEQTKLRQEKAKLLRAVKAERYFSSKKLRLFFRSRTLYRILRKANKMHRTLMDVAETQRLAFQNRDLFRALRKKTGRGRLIVIGTPVHGNLGDHAIAMAQERLLRDKLSDVPSVEIPMPAWLAFRGKIKRHIRSEDILLVSGGGWLGTLWPHNENTVRDILRDYSGNKVVILPQTVYYEDNANGNAELQKAVPIYRGHPDLTFCLRDRASYDFVRQHGLVCDPDRCLLIPDMVLYLNYSHLSGGRDGVLLCFREDCERALPDAEIGAIKTELEKIGAPFRRSSTLVDHPVPRAWREAEVEEKLKEYSGARLIITDRLHTMLFAAITGTPCIAFDNASGKVRGVYEWIRELDYIIFAETVAGDLPLIPYMLEMEDCHYDSAVLAPKYTEIIDNIVRKR